MLLWFAFILLPLPYWKQQARQYALAFLRCDLLSFYYLCRTGNNPPRPRGSTTAVVICFHFTTFAVLETTHGHRLYRMVVLWFAFILLPLPYWKQRHEAEAFIARQLWFAFILLPLPYWKQLAQRLVTLLQCCDLLSFYYLCRTGNNVIPDSLGRQQLWFAFILLPLPYWKQRRWSRTTVIGGCDLLSFYYLCRTGNNPSSRRTRWATVVICFHFTTFAVLETTWSSEVGRVVGCDLLSFYYLCRTGNNLKKLGLAERLVVICFHFTTFAVLETTTTSARATCG